MAVAESCESFAFFAAALSAAGRALMFNPENRLGDFLDREQPDVEALAKLMFAGITSVRWKMRLIEGQPGVKFQLSGAVVGSTDEMFDFLKFLDAIRMNAEGGGQ
jgi:hypothetical protein